MKIEEQRNHSQKYENSDRQTVEDVFDGDSRKSHHQRHAVSNQRGLCRLGNEEADKRQNGADGVTHHARAKGIPEAQPVRLFYAQHPGKRTRYFAEGRNRNHDQKTCSESLNPVRDLTEAGLLDEVSEKDDTEQGGNNSERSKASPSGTLKCAFSHRLSGLNKQNKASRARCLRSKARTDFGKGDATDEGSY